MVEDGLTDRWRQGVTGGNHTSASASLDGMNLAEHVSLPPSFSFLLSHWQVFVEHTLCSGDTAVNRTKAHLHGAGGGFLYGFAVLQVWFVEIRMLIPPTMEHMNLLRAGAFVITYSSEIVSLSFIAARFLLCD